MSEESSAIEQIIAEKRRRILSRKNEPSDEMIFICRVKNQEVVGLSAEKLPGPDLLIRYSSDILIRSTITRRNTENLHVRIFNILGECHKTELDALAREFLTLQGLALPPSRRNNVLLKLKQLTRQAFVSDKQLKSIRREILIEKMLEKRHDVLMSVRKGEYKMNVISDFKKAIRIVNDVDLEEFPSHLIYVNEYIPMLEDVLLACECENNCTSSCIHSREGSFSSKTPSKKTQKKTYNESPYDESGRLMSNDINIIYECNNACKCDESCPRRVVQKGSSASLEIFRTFSGVGWGVRTLEMIPKGTFVCRYAGELMRWGEAGERQHQEYLFDIDINKDSENRSIFTVDAYQYGNISRFINHCCVSNLSIHVVYINNIHPEKGHIAFFAYRDIFPNEELTINYEKLIKGLWGKCKCVNCTDKFIKQKNTRKTTGKKS